MLKFQEKHPLPALQCHEVPYGCKKFNLAEGFGEVAVRSRFAHLLSCLCIRFGSEKNHWNGFEINGLADSRDHLNAGHFGHHQVGDDGYRSYKCHLTESLFSILRRVDV